MAWSAHLVIPPSTMMAWWPPWKRNPLTPRGALLTRIQHIPTARSVLRGDDGSTIISRKQTHTHHRTILSARENLRREMWCVCVHVWPRGTQATRVPPSSSAQHQKPISARLRCFAVYGVLLGGCAARANTIWANLLMWCLKWCVYACC